MRICVDASLFCVCCFTFFSVCAIAWNCLAKLIFSRLLLLHFLHTQLWQPFTCHCARENTWENRCGWRRHRRILHGFIKWTTWCAALVIVAAFLMGCHCVNVCCLLMGKESDWCISMEAWHFWTYFGRTIEVFWTTRSEIERRGFSFMEFFLRKNSFLDKDESVD